MNITERYSAIKENIAKASARSHRNESEITLVAVTKFVPVERIAPALELGIRHTGENRAREFQDKLEFFREFGCFKHFIGQLQTNKVKYIIGQADLIQSVDRMELLLELQRQAQRHGITQDILIEVNIGAEIQKGGVEPDALPGLLEQVQELRNICVQGLMCIPPALNAEEGRRYFAAMRELFECCKSLPGVDMQHLSMGMSGDYPVAIEEGATMVRIGSALFGPRQQ